MFKKILIFLIGLNSLIFAKNINYTIEVIKPNIYIDKNFKIVSDNIDKKMVINPEKLKEKKYFNF